MNISIEQILYVLIQKELEAERLREMVRQRDAIIEEIGKQQKEQSVADDS